MKRKVLFVASLFMATTIFAQDGLTSKKGEVMLPEEGDYAIGFDADPFLDYVGNFLNGATNNHLDAGWVGNNPPMTIVGKMFKDASTAYRGKVRLGFGSASQDSVDDPVAGTVNTSKQSNFNLTVGAGMEKRKGNTRVQGFYGGEAMLGFGNSGTKEEYGTALSATNTNGGASRTTETKNGSSILFGVRGFAGIEVFIFPKTSIAFEYGWGLAFSSTGEGETTSEMWDGSAVVSQTSKTGGSSSFGIDTDNNGGAITALFHF